MICRVRGTRGSGGKPTFLTEPCRMPTTTPFVGSVTNSTWRQHPYRMPLTSPTKEEDPMLRNIEAGIYRCLDAKLGATRLFALLFTFLLMSVPALTSVAFTQAPAESRTDRFRRMSRDAETRGLADPFKGITTNGQPVSGLFAIKSTGVSTQPVRKAADAWL